MLKRNKSAKRKVSQGMACWKGFCLGLQHNIKSTHCQQQKTSLSNSKFFQITATVCSSLGNKHMMLPSIKAPGRIKVQGRVLPSDAGGREMSEDSRLFKLVTAPRSRVMILHVIRSSETQSLSGKSVKTGLIIEHWCLLVLAHAVLRGKTSHCSIGNKYVCSTAVTSTSNWISLGSCMLLMLGADIM